MKMNNMSHIIQSANRIFQTKQIEISNIHLEEITKFSAKAAENNFVISGTFYQGQSKLYEKYIRELSKAKIDAYFEVLKTIKIIDDNILNILKNDINQFLDQQINYGDTKLKQGLAYSGFPSSATNSILSGFRYGIARIKEECNSLIIEKYRQYKQILLNELGYGEFAMLSDHLNEKVILIKQNGDKIENIRANVQPKKIFIADSSVPIEEGDFIQRELPNGLIEIYFVEDRGFFSSIGGIEAHYQVSVRKESSQKKPTNQSIVYNLNGPNVRFNINSHDSSVNIANLTPENLFEELKNVIKKELSEANESNKLLNLIDELKDSIGKKNFIYKYQEFLSLVADHITIFAPFLPALSQLIVT